MTKRFLLFKSRLPKVLMTNKFKGFFFNDRSETTEKELCQTSIDRVLKVFWAFSEVFGRDQTWSCEHSFELTTDPSGPGLPTSPVSPYSNITNNKFQHLSNIKLSSLIQFSNRVIQRCKVRILSGSDIQEFFLCLTIKTNEAVFVLYSTAEIKINYLSNTVSTT